MNAKSTAAVSRPLPLAETHTPADQGALCAVLSDCHTRGVATYPIGGGTSLDYGLAPITPGVGIILTNLKRVIDYPARDMTVTVEAGITLDALSRLLAAERQWLPVEGPQPHAATLGGLMATAWSGPRRYGYGTMRDYVIGMTAVDIRGVPFKAGGRVVKNVAGYDFCKLLTGSLGTLGVISQITLKTRPIPERSVLLTCELPNLDLAERMLAAIIGSRITPSAVELLTGPMWREHPSLGMLTAGSVGRLVVALEGTAPEVDWMLTQLTAEWRELGVATAHVISGDAAAKLWETLNEFSGFPDAPLVLKGSVLPSRVTDFLAKVQEVDPQASIQAHAGNGIVIARFEQFTPGDISSAMLARLRPAAQLCGGSAIVLSSNVEGWTRQAWWGGAGPAAHWMQKVKHQFDPGNLLNPGRFAYDGSDA
jgi:glycolate oxidase FAD binding subunit